MRLLTLTLATALLAAACGGTAAPSPSATASPTPTAVAKVATDATLGKILVDQQGKTLYIWYKDTDENSTCYDACAAVWPPLLVESKNIGADGAVNGKFGATARKDGKLQATYNSHPLYTFVQDNALTPTKGHGSTGFGALWVVIQTP